MFSGDTLLMELTVNQFVSILFIVLALYYFATLIADVLTFWITKILVYIKVIDKTGDSD